MVDIVSLSTSPRSCLLVLSGPCGTGKTSLARALLEADSSLLYSRSVTTRQPRSGSVENYEYVTREEFLSRVEKREFVQWINPSYDEYYGTLRQPIDDAIARRRDMIFDYCPEGYLNLRRAYPAFVTGVFVMAPDVETMSARLRNRGTENDAELAMRYRMALQDFNFVDLHDYHVVNADFDHTFETLKAILIAEKAKVGSQPGLIENYASYSQPTLLRYYDAASGAR